MLRLTSRTMAQLAIQRLLPRQLILDLPTMAASLIPRLEVLALVVDLVGWASLPVIFLRHRLLRLGHVGVHLVRRVDITARC